MTLRVRTLVVAVLTWLACPPAMAQEHVTLQLKWRHAFQFAGYYMAQELGYYRQAGLDVEIREGGPDVDFVDEVLSGRADFATGSSGLVLDRNQGKPVVVLAVIFQHSPDVLIVPQHSNINTPKRLEGKRVMTSSSTPSITPMLLNASGSLDKFKLLEQTDDLDGLMAGRLEALAGYRTDQPFYFRQNGFPVTLLYPEHYGVDFYGDNLFTSERELREHPSRARAFRAASLRGWEYAMAHPAEAIAVIQKFDSTRSEPHLRFEYQVMRELLLPEFIELGHMHEARWRHIADTYVRQGQLERDYTLKNFLYEANPSIELSTFRKYTAAGVGLAAVGAITIVLLMTFNRRLKREIHERHQAEQRLRTSEHRLQEAQGIAHIGSWEVDLFSGQAIWSVETYKLLGYPPNSVAPTRENLLRAIHPEDRDKVVRQIEEAIVHPEGSCRIEFRVLLPDGETRVMDTRGRIAFDGQGEPVSLIATSLDITERKRFEQTLREQENYLRTIINHNPHCIKLLDHTGRLLDMNPAGLAMIEAGSLSEAQGRVLFGMVAEKDRPHVQAMVEAVFAGESRQLRFEIIGMKGTRRQLETHSVPLWNSPDRTQVRALLAVTRDITEQRRAEDRLRLSATVIESTREGVLVTDAELKIITVNRAFCEITGYSEGEILGRNPRALYSGRQNAPFYRQLWESVRDSGSWQGELWNRHKSGEDYPAWLSVNVVRDCDGNIANYVGVFSDISQLKQSQAQLEHLAHHDPLTQLPNRLLLTARMEHALERAERSRDSIAVLFLDLDRFKHINDSLGHNAGDFLLAQVSERLQAAVRREDTVARLGGDEFTVIMEELKHEEDAALLADKLIQTLSHPFWFEGRELFIGVSIGISIFPRDGVQVAQLLRNADAAMYHAKEEGRNTYRFYAEELTARAFEHVVLESQLRRAIEQDELTLHYQPQIDLRSGRLEGLEALVRWNHPEQGLVGPGRFIRIAEETGLIVPLGEWVLHAACSQGRAWLDEGLDFGYISVNVAGRQIQRGDLVAVVQKALADSGLPSPCLELEITESFVMKEAEQAIHLLHGIRALGVRLAIDDFGTGYSSLAYLRRLPFDKLKIDQSFVRDLAHDENDAAIARAIVALGHSLQFSVIAEGVETEAQRTRLLQDGCDQAQGYLFGRPVSALEIGHLLNVRADVGPVLEHMA
ncbi:EAL domain-containing protein [Methylococcus sp. EFPC2]|uniref:EAL domain-containing protein n=1 Tax=Methylococcus sp. EFPC2 TaxID=2812648 RepID=UPI00196830F1|nr:EAL domain-containing protein [Methylococcus sp. EFPC2]QSA96144.1 EAL domain-containing protein [Methylococcus sp. EFPC2]